MKALGAPRLDHYRKSTDRTRSSFWIESFWGELRRKVFSQRDPGSVVESCIFCRRDDSEFNEAILQNGTCYVRKDKFPVAAGHLEVIPNRHVESFFDLTSREVSEMYELIRSARDWLSREHGPDGYTIGVNEGRAAGRTIDHLHVHLIPRYAGDVPDPRGGVRNVMPGCSPDLWAPRRLEVGASERREQP